MNGAASFIEGPEELYREARLRVADQQAVVELLELRGHADALVVAKRFLLALEKTRDTARRHLEIECRKRGLRSALLD